MEHREINTTTLREWLDTGKEVNILDVRPSHEREEWFIPGSIHVDAYHELKKNNPNSIKSIELDKSFPVVTVCAAGKTSLIAADLLQKEGYEAYSLQGGMKSWSLAWNTASLSYDNSEIIQFRRTGKGCLSYLVISGNEAMVVDASLPVDVYREFLTQRNLHLKYVLETHIHADHLSRAKELAAAYGLLPSIPENNIMAFSFNPVFDGDTFSLGEVEVRAISTPGHTLESTCYLVNNKSLLTGDTLFIKGVGRPDLKADHHEAMEKAGLLYHSLEKLLELDNLVVVLPGHNNKPVAFDHKVIQASLGKIFSEIPLLSLGKEGFVHSILGRTPATPENYLTILEKNISGDFADTNPIDLEAGANRCAIL